jgi:hypothetical protein
VATEQDAAWDRVLAARAALDDELQALEASGRAAIDIPAKIRQSPAKAAAIAGGAGFLVLKGPSRLYRAARKAITGTPAPMPKRMLPKEIEKTLRSMGDDGDKVRGAIERDFADYAKKAEKNRRGIVSVLALALARPLVARAARAAGEYLTTPRPDAYASRLDQVRATARSRAEAARRSVEEAGDAARDRMSAAGDAARVKVDRSRASMDAVDDDTATGI